MGGRWRDPRPRQSASRPASPGTRSPRAWDERGPTTCVAAQTPPEASHRARRAAMPPAPTGPDAATTRDPALGSGRHAIPTIRGGERGGAGWVARQLAARPCSTVPRFHRSFPPPGGAGGQHGAPPASHPGPARHGAGSPRVPDPGWTPDPSSPPRAPRRPPSHGCCPRWSSPRGPSRAGGTPGARGRVGEGREAAGLGLDSAPQRGGAGPFFSSNDVFFFLVFIL